MPRAGLIITEWNVKCRARTLKEQSLMPPTNLIEALSSPNKRTKLARLGFLSGLPVSDETHAKSGLK